MWVSNNMLNTIPTKIVSFFFDEPLLTFEGLESELELNCLEG